MGKKNKKKKHRFDYLDAPIERNTGDSHLDSFLDEVKDKHLLAIAVFSVLAGGMGFYVVGFGEWLLELPVLAMAALAACLIIPFTAYIALMGGMTRSIRFAAALPVGCALLIGMGVGTAVPSPSSVVSDSPATITVDGVEYVTKERPRSTTRP